MELKDIGNALGKEAKDKIKKFIIRKIAIPAMASVMGIVLIAGVFMVITEAIKDAAGKVAEAASSVFGGEFDNTQDLPTITISDDLIEEIKKQLTEDAIDIDSTYLTDKLLKKSLEAYYATQYPYIEGANYTDDVVKGCIYLKRNDNDLKYINYNNFKNYLGDNKSESDLENAKKIFSMDDNDNIVVVTWSKSVKSVENTENGNKQGGTEGGYSITEYKIDQKNLTSSYAMSYKLPILLANLYSNEGFGIAVAELGINSKIELTVLDNTTKTETESKEYFKMNYKASGTCEWQSIGGPVSKNFEDLTWTEDYTTNPYKITTQITEENSITIQPTLLDTWVAKGEVSDITTDEKTTSNADNPDSTDLSNNPQDYTADPTISLTPEQQKQINDQMLEEKDEKTGAIVPIIKNINATIYKKMTDHKSTTTTTTTETTTTASDMELEDNTDGFLALIKANNKGEYDSEGKLVKYVKKENSDDTKEDVESEFLSSIDMVIEILERDDEVSDYANTMKYIYYKYTNDEDYKTELDFSAYGKSNFTSNKNNISADDFIVKTDETNAAPTVPKDQLEKGLKKWVSGSQQTNALKVLDKVIEYEKTYKVNAIFTYAIMRYESGVGTADSSWVRENNWMSLTSLGHIQYSSPQANIEKYCDIIANGTYYFKAGIYNLYGIGDIYNGSTSWSDIVKGFMVDLYNDCDVSLDTTSTGSAGSTGGNQGIVETAKSKMGCPYVYGAKGPNTFDCSGFVYWVYQQHGISVPGSTALYKPYKNSKIEISWNEAQPGDILLVFAEERGTTNGHAAIYLGDNKYIHAPQTGDVVKISEGAKSSFKHVFRFK